MRKLLLLFILILSLNLVVAIIPEDPADIKVNLTKTQYSEAEQIEGHIRLDLEDPVALNTVIRVELGDEIKTKKLVDILDDLSLSYEEKDAELETSTAAQAKTLIFTAAGSQQFSIKLPKMASVNSIALNVQGLPQNNVFPKAPSLDVSSDSYREFEFFGDFKGFREQTQYPSSLTLTSESSTFVANDLTYYCEIINLPQSKDFNIMAKYGLSAADKTGGNIKAAILSFSQSGSNVIAQGGADNCDLPEPSSTERLWQSCSISFNNLLSGDHLVCVYDANTASGAIDNRYKLSSDTTTADKGYTCKNPGSTQACQKLSTGDFFIGVQGAEYEDELRAAIGLAEGSTQFNFAQSLTDYLKTCQPQPLDCIIPVEASSQSAGKLFLSNLQIIYTSSGVTREENNFYDVITKPGYIHKIDGTNISRDGYKLEIPFSLFELAAPDIDVREKKFKLEAHASPGPSEDDEITVTAGIPSVSSINLVTSTYDTLNGLLTTHGQFIALYDPTSKISNALSEIQNYKTQYETASVQERASIDENVRSLMSNLPISITIRETATDVVKITPSDGSGFIDPAETEQLYYYQKTLNVRMTAKLYEIESFNRKKSWATEITKSISNIPSSGELYEIIPLSVSAGDLRIEGSFIDKGNGIYQSNVRNSLRYVIPSNIMSSLSELKTIVRPSAYPREIEEAYAVCGDGECTFIKVDNQLIPLEDALICPQDCKKKRPYSVLIIAIVLLAIGVYYINFFHPKPKSRLFSTRSDEKALTSYVKKTMKKGLGDKEIVSILAKKGWNKSQIDHAMGKARK